MCVHVHRWCSSQLEKESGKGAISAQLALIASTLFWWAAALCEMTKCCIPGPPALAPPPLLMLKCRQPQPEGTQRGRRDCKYICCCHCAFSPLTLLISSSPRPFVSAVALAQYLPDTTLLPLCFPPDVSAFSLNSTSASLFSLRCLFHLLSLNVFPGSVS